jgi:hypothetical protein
MNSQESQQEETRKHRENCRRILAISSKIRYVGIMNKFGRTMAGQLRKDMIPLFKPEEARNENFIEATRFQLRKSFEESIGKAEYSFTENEKVKILTFPNESNLYYITLDKNTESQEFTQIVESVKKLVRQ